MKRKKTDEEKKEIKERSTSSNETYKIALKIVQNKLFNYKIKYKIIK